MILNPETARTSKKKQVRDRQAVKDEYDLTRPGCAICGRSMTGKRRDALACSTRCGELTQNKLRLGKRGLNPECTDNEPSSLEFWSKKAANRIDRVWSDSITLTSSQILNQLDSQNKLCYWCQEFMFLGDQTLDHVVPLFLFGSHTMDNIVVCCKSCNFQKSNKSVDVWTEQLLLLGYSPLNNTIFDQLQMKAPTQ